MKCNKEEKPIPKYIDINKIKFTGDSYKDFSNETLISLGDVRLALSQAPEVDVAEVRHGVWIIDCDGYYPYCSLCKYEPERPYSRADNRTSYCPNCGAKMRKEYEC